MTPPKPPPKRLQSPTERELASDTARRLREAVPIELDYEELTDRFEGEELERMRAQRAEDAPEVSLTKLEKKHDALALDVGALSKSVTDMRVEHAEQMGDMKGAIGGLAGEVRGLAAVVKENRDKDHLTFTAKVDVDRAKHISDVNVQQAEKLDSIAARKAKRDFYLKILAAILGGGVLGKILHMAGLW